MKKIKKFLKDHPEEIAASAIVAGCYIFGIVVTAKTTAKITRARTVSGFVPVVYSWFGEEGEKGVHVWFKNGYQLVLNRLMDELPAA